MAAARLARAVACLLLFALAAEEARAYTADTRQALTFTAAKRFNRCVEGTDVPRLTALQVRNLVRGNLREAERNFLRRSMRWSYYDRSGVDDKRLLWTIETRMGGRYDATRENVLAEAGVSENDRYVFLGIIAHYVQTVTVPADVVPIFHPRPWRWPAGDRFTQYELDPEVLAGQLGDLCPELLATPPGETFKTLLDRTAAATMAAIRSPIADMDATWHAFWEEDEPGRFGSYGPAGNSFGRGTRFPCGEDRCLLLDDDPIYAEFAARQQRLAVLGTMRAVLLLQRFRAARDASLLEIAEPYRDPANVDEDTGG
ncbi:MAG: hypothetical protein V2J24_17270 [Pseudomonadales bacterium]|jgi:hypothetical protein|nr:hypothetical protein [Pseudomonadales bacterium]